MPYSDAVSEQTVSRSWMTTPFARVGGAVASWFLFALSFTLLYTSALAVIGLGGYCASGGPYVIETECPQAVAMFMPLSIFGGLIAVGISLALARGFGTPLIFLAWPILFCGLSVTFFVGYAGDTRAWSWLLIGIMFVVMGLVPLVGGLYTDARAVLIGSVSLEGRPFHDRGDRPTWLPRRPRPDEPVEPGGRDWILAIATTLVGACLGVWLGLELFHAVGG